VDVGAKAGGLCAGIFSLEVDKTIDGKEAASTLVGVAAPLNEGENGLVDVDPAGVL